MQPPADGLGALPYLAVTFTVHEWFRGGDRTTVTVDMLAPRVSSAQETSFGIGTRLLVSGGATMGRQPPTGSHRLGCGFTRYYDQPTAGSWRQTLRQK
jgi:hypothetical protein